MRKIREKFGRSGNSLSICPGEANCMIFQGARGESREQKERSACLSQPIGNTGQFTRGCDLYPTKLSNKTSNVSKWMNEAVGAQVYRNSGYLVDKDEISSLGFQALLLLDSYEKDFKDAQQSIVNESIITLSKMFNG